MTPKKIVVLGASSVFGKVDTQGGFTGRLKSWYEAKDREYNMVFNLGIPGDTTTGMAKRAYRELVVRKPDLIIYSLGSNDIAHVGSSRGKILTPYSEYKQNIKKMIIDAKKVSKHVIFVSAYPIIEEKLQPLKKTDWYYSSADLAKYTNETKKICNELKIPYLDIYSVFIEEGYKKYLFKDGLHCNYKGHKKIFTELILFLQKHYNI